MHLTQEGPGLAHCVHRLRPHPSDASGFLSYALPSRSKRTCRAHPRCLSDGLRRRERQANRLRLASVRRGDRSAAPQALPRGRGGRRARQDAQARRRRPRGHLLRRHWEWLRRAAGRCLGQRCVRSWSRASARSTCSRARRAKCRSAHTRFMSAMAEEIAKKLRGGLTRRSSPTTARFKDLMARAMAGRCTRPSRARNSIEGRRERPRSGICADADNQSVLGLRSCLAHFTFSVDN